MSAQVSSQYSAPVADQDTFDNHYDNEEPVFSVSEYARIMHEHTKAQLSTAASSARRRSQASDQTSNTNNHVDATP